jgi:DNA polymerase-3 subunit epsilon
MKEIVVVDIETSGFQKKGGLIVEVGIVALNLDTGNIFNEFNEIVKEKDFGEKHAKYPYGWIFKNSDLKYEDVLPCLMLSAAPVVDLPPNPGYPDPKWPKVQEAWDFFFPSSAYKEAHRALDDARHEALIAYELYKLGKFRV